MADQDKQGYDLETTTLRPILKKIIAGGKKAVRFNYEGILHTVKENIPITKLISLDIIRDYGGKVGDYGYLEVLIPMGVYTNRIYPYRNNLEFTIKRMELQEEGMGLEKNKKPLITKYKAIFLADQNPIVNAKGPDMANENDMDISNIVTLKLQVVDRSLEPLRIKTTDGVYKNFDHKTIIHSTLLYESYKILIDGKPAVDGLDIVEPDNTETHKHVVVPMGTKIIDMPTFLHNQCRGIYSAGIGTYLQLYKKKKLWFVYPLFNNNRFNTNAPKVIFYGMPEHRMPGMDRTFIEDGKLLQVIITAERNYNDQADVDNMNDGNGIRQSVATSYMHKPIEITADGPVAQRTKLNREFNDSNREDGLNYAPFVNNDISNNSYLEQSLVVSRKQGRVNINWENSDPELLYPGMPCKYIYTLEGKPVELNGTVIGMHTYIALEGKGVTGNSYRTMSQVFLTVDAYKSIPKVKDRKFKGNI